MTFDLFLLDLSPRAQDFNCVYISNVQEKIFTNNVNLPIPYELLTMKLIHKNVH